MKEKIKKQDVKIKVLNKKVLEQKSGDKKYLAAEEVGPCGSGDGYIRGSWSKALC